MNKRLQQIAHSGASGSLASTHGSPSGLDLANLIPGTSPGCCSSPRGSGMLLFLLPFQIQVSR